MNYSLDDIVAQLASKKIQSPRLETRMILAYILGVDASEIQPSQLKLTEEQNIVLEDILK